MTPAEAAPPIVSPRARQVVYALYALGSVILGAVQVGYSAGQYEQPVWLTIATAVWVFLGGSQGLLALLNTAPPLPGEGGE
ncbi:hypothetical protein [Rothia sp. ZJ1223]|uniref:hypothetical protein n=1 Tax=Rothia sp. ZJ1223 TaxID=2811098 RepID=UPI001956584B|nr:hypothetical protein [Rothia sp. ZJ1223]MBM7052211.1 hypothetical protein [Rothia sp. ZJ1223]